MSTNKKSNNQVNVPSPNWEKIFTFSAVALFFFTILVIFARIKTLVVISGILDVVCIFCLISVMGYAWIKKNQSKN